MKNASSVDKPTLEFLTATISGKTAMSYILIGTNHMMLSP